MATGVLAAPWHYVERHADGGENGEGESVPSTP